MKTLSTITLMLLLIVCSCKDHKHEEHHDGHEEHHDGHQVEHDTEKARKQTITTASANIFKAWNTNDIALFNANSVENVERILNGKEDVKNQEGYKKIIETNYSGFPDLKLTLTKQIIQGDKSYNSWTFTGTNTGVLGKIPATGKSVVDYAFTIWTFNKEGKLTKEETYYDNLSFMAQLGFTLSPPTPTK